MVHRERSDSLGVPGAPSPLLEHFKKQQKLFVIERSKNSNQVIYEALLDNDGLNQQKPVDVYWIMKATHGNREELNVLERTMAYGLDFEEGEQGQLHWHYTIKLKAFPQRKVDVFLDEKLNAHARMEIWGRSAFLDRIYIQAKETRWLPKVLYIDLFGRLESDPSRQVTERLYKDTKDQKRYGERHNHRKPMPPEAS